MALRNVPYAAQTAPQMQELDQTFADVSALGIIPCTATGTNSIVLAPGANTPSVAAYANFLRFAFFPVNTSTGPVTVQFSGLSAIPLFKAGTTSSQCSLNDVVVNTFLDIAYSGQLNSGAGGAVIVSAMAPPNVVTTNTAFPTVIFQDRVNSGSGGGALVVNTFFPRQVTTVTANTLVSGGTIGAGNQTFGLPQGQFDLTAFISAQATGTGKFRHRLVNTNSSAVQVDVNGNDIVSLNVQTNALTVVTAVRARFALTSGSFPSGASFQWQTWTDSGAANAGSALNGTGNTEPEVYLSAEFVKIA